MTTLAHELANEQVHREIRMAAGLALKNAFTARDMHRLRELQEKWLRHVPAEIKRSVKELALQTLAAGETQVGQAAAQFITSIAAIEIPRDQWPELMPTLVQYVNDKSPQLRQLALTTIGYICNEPNVELRNSLDQHSNAILTAVVQGVHKDETSSDVRYAAIEALLDSLEFVRSNFDNEGERNYIMQVVCEATQSDDSRVQAGAFGCLIKIMSLYYEQMQFYMEKALFGLTVMGMKSDNEDVSKLAVEFWSTVCEEEIQIADDNRRVGDPSSLPFPFR